jgi:hypothetical protein
MNSFQSMAIVQNGMVLWMGVVNPYLELLVSYL